MIQQDQISAISDLQIGVETYLQTDENIVGTAVPAHAPEGMVYSHIRDLSGIIDTIYGTTLSPPHFEVHEIGCYAGYYLHAHGYVQETIDYIRGLHGRQYFRVCE